MTSKLSDLCNIDYVPLFWTWWNLKNSSSLRGIFHNCDPVSDIIDVLSFVPAKSFLNKHEWESKSYVQHFYIWDYVRHWTRNDHVCSPKSDLTFNLPFSALTDSNSPTAFNSVKNQARTKITMYIGRPGRGPSRTTDFWSGIHFLYHTNKKYSLYYIEQQGLTKSCNNIVWHLRSVWN